jgi:uncharacterized protein
VTHKFKCLLSIKAIANFAVQKPIYALLISAFIVALSVFGLTRLKIELDLYNTENFDFVSLEHLWEMKDSFQDSNSLEVLIEWPQNPTAKQICSLTRKLRDIESMTQDTKSVFHLFQIRKLESAKEHYWFPFALPDPCLSGSPSSPEIFNSLDKNHPASRFYVSPSQLLIQIVFEKNFSVSSVGEWLHGLKSEEYKTYSIGSALFKYYLLKILKSDSIFHILILVFLFLFFRAFTGTWLAGFLYLGTLILTSTCTAGLMGILGLPIDALSNNLFLITALAGTADFLFLCWGLVQKNTFYQSIKRFCTPCFFTTLTTMIGFLSLMSSDLAMIRNFGLAAAIGALLEWFFTFFTLSAFIIIIKKENALVNTNRRPAWLNKVSILSQLKLPRIAVVAFICLLAASPFLFQKIKFKEDPLSNFPDGHVLKSDHEYFMKTLGWQGLLYLMAPRNTERSDFESCLKKIEKMDLVAEVSNPYANIDYFTKNQPADRQRSIIFELEKWGPLKKLFSIDWIRAPIYLKSTNPENLENLVEMKNQHCSSSFWIVGQSEVYREVSNKLSQNLIESFAISIAIVIIIILILIVLYKKENGFSIILSLLFGPLAMISIMALLNIPVNPMNSLFLAILVGITGDNAIQYIMFNDGKKIENAVNDLGPASIIQGLLMAFGCLFFLFQTLMPMKILGMLFFLGFILNLIGDLWFLKGLLELKNYLTNRSTTPKAKDAPKA